jgi:hypothetical protein
MLLPAIYKISQLLTRAYIRTLESDTTAICPMKIYIYIYIYIYRNLSTTNYTPVPVINHENAWVIE